MQDFGTINSYYEMLVAHIRADPVRSRKLGYMDAADADASCGAAESPGIDALWEKR